MHVTRSWLMRVPETHPEVGFLLAGANCLITHDEAELAGLIETPGIGKNLAMMVAVAREAGASYEWISKEIEIPAITLINKEMERWKKEGMAMPAPRGRPLDLEAQPKSAMLRVKRHVEQGRAELVRLFGEDWAGLLVKRQ
ncbi:MAG: hypothetical protein GEU28_08620 [Dehalococcoidia bacterium]|nr:hypothetical protein [Dehalococcoidia bacterium]